MHLSATRSGESSVFVVPPLPLGAAGAAGPGASPILSGASVTHAGRVAGQGEAGQGEAGRGGAGRPAAFVCLCDESPLPPARRAAREMTHAD